MSHYHIERKRAAVEAFRHAKRLRTEHGAKWLNPASFASVVAGGASTTQVYQWMNTDLSTDVQEQKEERRGSARMLSEEQEALLVGFAIWSRSSLKPVSLKTLRQFCVSHLNVTPSLSTLSRIISSHGFSSQKTLSRNSRMVSPQVVEDALDAIKEIRSYEMRPDRVLFMDETGLWSNVVAGKTYHFRTW